MRNCAVRLTISLQMRTHLQHLAPLVTYSHFSALFVSLDPQGASIDHGMSMTVVYFLKSMTKTSYCWCWMCLGQCNGKVVWGFSFSLAFDAVWVGIDHPSPRIRPAAPPPLEPKIWALLYQPVLWCYLCYGVSPCYGVRSSLLSSWFLKGEVRRFSKEDNSCLGKHLYRFPYQNFTVRVPHVIQRILLTQSWFISFLFCTQHDPDQMRSALPNWESWRDTGIRCRHTLVLSKHACQRCRWALGLN